MKLQAFESSLTAISAINLEWIMLQHESKVMLDEKYEYWKLQDTR
jgi:hypothetical protein